MPISIRYGRNAKIEKCLSHLGMKKSAKIIKCISQLGVKKCKNCKMPISIRYEKKRNKIDQGSKRSINSLSALR